MFDSWKSLKKFHSAFSVFFGKCERIPESPYLGYLKKFKRISGSLCLICNKVWKSQCLFLGNVEESTELPMFDFSKNLKNLTPYIWFLKKFERISGSLCLTFEKIWKNLGLLVFDFWQICSDPSVFFLGNVKEFLWISRFDSCKSFKKPRDPLFDPRKSLKESRVLYVWFLK